MKIRNLLVMAAASAAVASASAFEWSPVVQQPNPSFDVTQPYQLETLRLAADMGLEATDVMPVWIDDDNNEIVGTYSSFSDPSWGDYIYDFNFADFKSNGEYTLKLPEGLLKNASGELSDEKTFYFTVNIEDLAAGMFDDFKVLSVSPDLSEPQAIWNEQKVVINTNHNDAIGLTTLQITDLTTQESIFISRNNNLENQRGLGNASEISWEVVGNFTFYEGHEYKAEFVFYNGVDEKDADGIPTRIVDRASYTFTGRVEGYKYSSETLLSITPAPYSLTITEPSQAVFTYEFSGPVNVYKALTAQGMFGVTVYPESCLSSNEDKTVWTLNISDQEYIKTVDAELAISIYARDLEGYQLKGDDGEGDNSCFTAAWRCDIGAKGIAVVSPEAGQTLDRLSEIVVKSESGEAMKWSWVGEAYVQNLLGENLGKLWISEEENPGEATEFHFTEWVPSGEESAVSLDIVTEGSYVIYFGPGCFVFGEEFSAVNSRSVYSGFQITGALDEKPDQPVDPSEQETFNLVKSSPEVGSTVASLEKIQLWYPEAVACEEFTVTVLNKADGSEVTTGTGMYDWDDWNLINIDLAEPVTEAGEYEVVVPARVIGTDEFLSSGGEAGICNPELKLLFVVGEVAPADPQEALRFVTSDPEVGSTVESLNKILLYYGEPVVCDDFEVEVYSAVDGLVSTGVARMDYAEDTMVVITLFEPINVDGMYDVVIPARQIINGDWYYSDGAEGLCNPEYHLNFTVEAASGPVIDPAEQEVFIFERVAPEDGATVASLSKINLWYPDIVDTTGKDALVYKLEEGAEPALVNFGVVVYDWDDLYMINVELDEPIEEAGEYEVVIPARAICDGEFFESDGKKGICNPEIRLRYTVGNENGLNYTVLPVEGDVAELHTVEITFADTESAFWNIKEINDNPEIAPVLTCNGEPSVDISNLYSTGNVLYAAVASTIKVDGTYVLTIPAESYFLEGVESSEIILVYNLDTALAVKAVFGENVNADVYDVNGRLVIRNANASDLKGLRGVFVINGKKYILR